MGGQYPAIMHRHQHTRITRIQIPGGHRLHICPCQAAALPGILQVPLLRQASIIGQAMHLNPANRSHFFKNTQGLQSLP